MTDLFPMSHVTLAHLVNAGFEGSTLSDSNLHTASGITVLYEDEPFITFALADYTRCFGRFDKKEVHPSDFGIRVDDLVGIANFLLQDLADLGYQTHKIVNLEGSKEIESMLPRERIPLSRICPNCEKSGGLKEFIFGPLGPNFNSSIFMAGGRMESGTHAKTFCELCKAGTIYS